MSDINPITRPQHSTFEKASRTASTTSSTSSASRTSDRVELSDQARLLSKLKQLPEVREDLVNSIKSQIDSGNYDTEERFDTAINALIDDQTS